MLTETKIEGIQLLTKHIEINKDQEQLFIKFYDSLLAWNQKINLISRKDTEALFSKHILHSLSISKVQIFKKDEVVVDIGTGGGLPGIPLAILFPETQFILTDSIFKKAFAVEKIIEELGLQNVRVVHSRVEHLQKIKVDYFVSRAVAPLIKLWEWTNLISQPKHPKHSMKALICLKGGDLNQEIQDSNLMLKSYPIQDFFPLDIFESKYIVYIDFKENKGNWNS